MSRRYIPPTPTPPTHILSSLSIPNSLAHDVLKSYLTRSTSSTSTSNGDTTTTTSTLWSHSHDAGTTASLRKLELSLRGINGVHANEYLTAIAPEDGGYGDLTSNTDQLDAADKISGRVVIDTDEGDNGEESIRMRRALNTVDEGDSEDDDGPDGGMLKELVDVKSREDQEEDEEFMRQEEERVELARKQQQREENGVEELNEEDGRKPIDKEERKRLKKERMKQLKRDKEEARRGVGKEDEMEE